MAPVAKNTRVFLRYRAFGAIAHDVNESIATILASTQGAANTSIATRHIALTIAKDGIVRQFAVDNIAGLEDVNLITDTP